MEVGNEIAAEEKILLGMKNLLRALTQTKNSSNSEAIRDLESQIETSHNKIAALSKQAGSFVLADSNGNI